MKRNIGIELLRNISMIFIIVIHVMNVGGILDTADRATYHAKIAWTFFILAYCGVNCFALISGYVGWNRSIKLSRVVLLWIQTLFYSVIITVIFALVRPDLIDGSIWKAALLPITSTQYWYVTAYFGMLLLSPLLNYGIQNISFKGLSLIVLCAFVFGMTIPCLTKMDPFSLSGGYSTIWLCILYVIGGYISKYDISSKVRKWQMFAVYAISAFATFMAYRRQHMEWVDYTSPTIFICAVSLLMFCVNISVKENGAVSRIIKLLSPSALSVYLIHVHPLIYSNVINGRFAGLLSYNIIVFTVLIILIILGIYFLCIICDIPRRIIIRATKLQKRLCLLDRWLER